MPRGTSGSSANSASESNTLGELRGSAPASCGRSAVPISSASARSGAEAGSVGDAGPQLAEEAPRCCAGTAAGAGTRGSPCRSVGGCSEIDSCRNGRATPASAVKVVSRFTNSAACSSATGATSAAARAEAREEAVEPGARVGEVARPPAAGRASSGRSSAIASFRSRPRPGEAAAEAVERLLRSRAGPALVERVEDLVDLDRLGRGLRAAGSSRPRSKPALLIARRELDVLEAERRARPHDAGGVHRAAARGPCRAWRHHGVHPVAVLHRVDLVDRRRPARRRCAPRCPHQVGRVGQLASRS